MSPNSIIIIFLIWHIGHFSYRISQHTLSEKRYKSGLWGCTFSKGKLLSILGANMYILGANIYILGVNMYILGANKYILAANKYILGANKSI